MPSLSPYAFEVGQKAEEILFYFHTHSCMEVITPTPPQLHPSMEPQMSVWMRQVLGLVNGTDLLWIPLLWESYISCFKTTSCLSHSLPNELPILSMDSLKNIQSWLLDAVKGLKGGGDGDKRSIGSFLILGKTIGSASPVLSNPISSNGSLGFWFCFFLSPVWRSLGFFGSLPTEC